MCFEAHEELFIAIFRLEVNGVEVLQMGNWRLIRVVIDFCSPVDVLLGFLYLSQLYEQPLVRSVKVLVSFLLGLYLVLGDIFVNGVHLKDLLGS